MKRGRWFAVLPERLVFMLAVVSVGGCGSAPPPAALSPGDEAQVDALLRTSKAIVSVAEQRLKTSQYGDAAWKDANAAQSAARTMGFTIRNRQGNAHWLEDARGWLNKAEASLTKALGETIRPEQCDETVRIALATLCGKLLADAETDSTSTKRADDIRKALVEAVALNGDHRAPMAVADQTMKTCRATPDACSSLVKDADDESRVGVLVGIALLNLDRIKNDAHSRDPAKVETLLAASEDIAKRVRQQVDANIAARAALKAKLGSEEVTLAETSKTCEANPKVCKAKCDANDAMFCAAWGKRLWMATPPKFSEAKVLISKACTAQVQTACNAIAALDKDFEAAQAETNERWDAVESWIQDIVTLRHMNQVARSLPLGRRQRAAIPVVDAQIASKMKDGFCPAKRAFIERAGGAEFARRSQEKCDKNAPFARVDSGMGDVPRLVADCRAVMAAACSSSP